MTEDALNLMVSELIEDDGQGSRTSSASGNRRRLPDGAIPQQLLSGVNVNSHTNSLTKNVAMNDLSQGIASNIPIPNNPPTTVLAPGPAASPASLDVWFYCDPQGSVQGPFNTVMGTIYVVFHHIDGILLN